MPKVLGNWVCVSERVVENGRPWPKSIKIQKFHPFILLSRFHFTIFSCRVNELANDEEEKKKSFTKQQQPLRKWITIVAFSSWWNIYHLNYVSVWNSSHEKKKLRKRKMMWIERMLDCSVVVWSYFMFFMLLRSWAFIFSRQANFSAKFSTLPWKL